MSDPSSPWNGSGPAAPSPPRTVHPDGYHRPDAPEPRPLGVLGGNRTVNVQSLRSARRTLVLAVLGFAVGALAVVLNSPLGGGFLAPGPLADSHAQILAGLDGQRCAACHENGNLPVAEWLSRGFSGVPAGDRSVCQSDLCLKCHSGGIGSEFAMQAHSHDPALLAEITRDERRQIEGGRPSPELVSHTPVGPDLACGTCHREHRGGKGLRAQLTDRQCQTCHVRRFDGFEHDHPAFAIAGGAGHGGIPFDHATHGMKHFPAGGREFQCQSCHPAGPQGNVRTLAPFESSCASCHEPAIRDSQLAGLELIAIPMLDIAAIHAAGHSLEDWPLRATGDFDGRLPPLMKLLLAGDAEMLRALERLPPDFSFSRLDPKNPTDLQTAAELGRGIQRLMRDIRERGSEGLLARWKTSFPDPRSGSNDPGPVKDLLPDDRVLSQLVSVWMPVTKQPVAGVDRNHNSAEPSRGTLDGFAMPVHGQRNHPSIGPDELLAENPIRGRIQKPQSLSTPGGSEPDPWNDAESASQSEQSAQTDRPNRFAPAGSPLPGVQQVPGGNPSIPATVRSDSIQQEASAAHPPASESRDWLAENPLKALRKHGLTGETPAQAASGSLTVENQLAENLADRPPQGDQTPSLAEHQPESTPAVSSFVSPTPPAVAGSGWDRDDSLLVLRRLPAGHADPWLKQLLEALCDSGDATPLPHRFGRELAVALSSPSAPGQCTSCHSAARSDSPGSQHSWSIAWRAETRDPAFRGFTKFNHQPHTIVRDCQTCHALEETDSGTGSPGVPTIPSRLAGWTKGNASAAAYPTGLKAVSVADCASCHREGGSPSGCTTCHNYHLHPTGTPQSWSGR